MLALQRAVPLVTLLLSQWALGPGGSLCGEMENMPLMFNESERSCHVLWQLTQWLWSVEHKAGRAISPWRINREMWLRVVFTLTLLTNSSDGHAAPPPILPYFTPDSPNYILDIQLEPGKSNIPCCTLYILNALRCFCVLQATRIHLKPLTHCNLPDLQCHFNISSFIPLVTPLIP